ncbi:2-hydroxyacyl-CoA dehydratase subunit D [Methanospirillum lacunae]|uniref:2-hydroxyacyl-CoA dehydratase n=1 Tax=Methanospirillum lacunae TaxID=668570 RepID=A0A2V2N4Y9_9EURY|nr:2-hydroxyacyl-CoA dehydratase family protein [Methanospirillum lacunae]PWR71267.1 2-hydroxyacyl-CoA dehydratase [Methanospirillum lacunae]
MRVDYPPFTYPDEIKPLVLETEDLNFSDGTTVTAEQIWHFMTVTGPKRFPFAFSTNPAFGHQLSGDVSLISGIRRNYLGMTGIDRLRKFVRNKTPLILVQGGITSDLYQAAGCISVGPMFLRGWIMNTQEGRAYKNANLTGASLLEEARQNLSFECCNLIANVGLLKTRDLPISAIAPCLCSRCSDMAYAVEAYRSESSSIPTILIDYPSNFEEGEWRVEYIKEELHSLVHQLEKVTGKEVTDDDIRKEIKIQNKARSLVRECEQVWWSGKVPPTNSVDGGFAHLGMMGAFDFPVANQVLKETRDELQTRVNNGVKGFGLVDDPARLFVCGSCVMPNANFVDRKGGVLVGSDDVWSSICMNVKETGDPYENLAVSYASLPYERSTEERAKWTVEQVKASRADGVVFMFNWGCNYQSAIAGMITDYIKEETGLPAISIEVGELTRMESLEQSHNRVESFIEMIKSS